MKLRMKNPKKKRAYLRLLQSRPPARLHLFRGERMTAREIAEHTGIKIRTIYSRIQHGIPIEGTGRHGPEPRQYAFRGKLATIKEIMAETGLSLSQTHKRTDGKRFFERGEAVDQYAEPRWNARILFYAGISDSVSGWARRTGLPRYVIHERINTMGWPLKRVLTEPVMTATQRVVYRRNRNIIRRIAFNIKHTGGCIKTSQENPRTGAVSQTHDLQSERANP